ncbi:MAG: type II toxin-antitoxin system RelE/ParE family toxin [Porticoccaceae bacterium]
MHIEWSEIAVEDLAGIQRYIGKDAPYYADQFIDRLISATDKLADFPELWPELGRRVPETGKDAERIRELIFHGYRIIYQVDQTAHQVLIVTVVHGSRDLAAQEPKPWEIV